MHGSSPGISVLPSNADVDSLSSSPRLAAIEKAQAELRREYESREERKRELEFLEKGGNPLDFSFPRAASASADVSEAKGSFAARGDDSVESSGRPAPALAAAGSREPNSADNFGENVKNGKRAGKRVTPEQHKGQAYARRNRSRTGRGAGAAVALAEQVKSEKVLPLETQAENNGVSSVSNVVAADNNPKDMEIDVVQEGEKEVVKVSEDVRDMEVDCSKKDIDANGEQVECPEKTSSDLVEKRQETDKLREISVDEKIDVDKNVTDGGDLKMKENDLHAEKADEVVGVDHDEKIAVENGVDGGSRDLEEPPIVQPVPENNESREKTTDDSGSNNLKKATVRIKLEAEASDNVGETPKETADAKNESEKPICEVAPKSEKNACNSFGDSSNSTSKALAANTLVLPTSEPATTVLVKRGTSTISSSQNCAASSVKLAKKVHEDAILKEARTIEVNLKRASERPVRYISLEKRTKCHWDFVLKEMAWMANDFMQERIWKTSVAAHICHQAASARQKKNEQKIISLKQQNIAKTLAIAVMNFWHSADMSRNNMDAYSGTNGECTSDLSQSCKLNGTKEEKDQDISDMEAKNHCFRPTIQSYAIRFLDKYGNGKFDHPDLAEGPTNPDIVCDEGAGELTWEDQLSEESLFYTVAPGAMQSYREAVESQCNHKNMCNSVHPEDCDASVCDSIPDGPREYVYEEEGETGPYFMPGAFEGSLSTIPHKKKKKSQPKSYAPRLYDAGSDFSYDPYLEGTSANQGLMVVGKRPSNSLNVCSIPTKRVRTAARHRIVPFGPGVSGNLHVNSKTDVSSEDTNSFQDDQSSMHGGSQVLKNMEVESTMDFEKHLPYDGIETSMKSKNKKKSKHAGHTVSTSDSGVLVVTGKGSLLDQRLQNDSMAQHEQRDHVRKRPESQHLESNGNIGTYGHHVAKKPKHSWEPSPDIIMPGTGSLPSPAASQMSNMSNQNKLIKITANRDRGRKNKALKMAAGPSGSGLPWTNFEEQALVVLVHDMGQNWELVSDAINSTLQFKCIFRKPNECKERHKYIMEKSAGDGADSAEDSGSSQPYKSTLPGIPKGSARQLFQRLQGPIEEDVLKTHFEKIILIGQQLHSRRNQINKQEQKLLPVHSSHLILSQACPNGSPLTPFDLCDPTASSSEALAYQGSHPPGAAIPSQQGPISPVISTSGVNNVLQSSSGIVQLNSNFPSPSASMNGPARDVQRYCVPRNASQPVEDQQRMQYNQMLSSRTIQQSGMSAPVGLPVGVDRGGRMLAGANGVGMMNGRAMPMARPGFQGPSGMLNMVSAGSMLPGTGVGIPNTVNSHSTAAHGTVNTMMRPREMMRPNQNTEDDRRQMIMQDLQSQVSQGGSQVVPPFNGLSSPFSTATGLPSVQSYPSQPHQQSHQMLGNPHQTPMQGTNQSSAQQHAYAIRFAKERQQQQRMLPQPQQPYASSSTMSSMPNSSQQQTQPPSSVIPTPSSQAQHSKQHMARNMQSSTGMSNPMAKPRQRPQVQQQPRQHQAKPLMQPAMHMKGAGRGTMMVHQNVPVDPRHPAPEKPMLQQGQSFFSGNPTSVQSSNQNKVFVRPPSQPSKQVPTLPSNPDICNQNSLQVSSNRPFLAPQPHLPNSISAANPLSQQHHRQMNQNMQRIMLQQNRPLTSDGKIQATSDALHANQMAPAAALASSASITSSASQQKLERPSEISTTAHTAPRQDSLGGTDTSVPPSNDGSTMPRVNGASMT